MIRRLIGGTLAVLLLTTGGALPAEATPRNPFVTRDGSTLEVGGKPFRFAGTNIYWLGLDENVGGIDYPTFFRIRDALDTAKTMGLTVVRSHMLASSGHPKTILPATTGPLNEEAFRTVDYAIAYAGKLGLRLILPLTDNWAYYHGGHGDFTKPHGLPDSAFYTDPRVIADYQRYAKRVMHRKNPLTGKRYADDPTILAWELGNELEGMTPEWITANASQFREWAPRQLIAAGRRFDIDPDTLAADAVDIVDVHYYPPTAAKVAADAATVAAAGKVYVAGEYASTAAGPELLDPLVPNRQVSGMMSWSLFGHADDHGFVQHDDGFTFHYPGDDSRMTASVQAQTDYARALGSKPWTPSSTPLLTSVTKRAALNVLAWRGAAGATGYRVQKARTPLGPWTAAHSGLLTDNQTPWTDAATRGDAWYRVVTADGRTSLPRTTYGAVDSAPVTGPPAAPTLVAPAPDGPLTFTWDPATGAGLYSLAVSRNADLSDPVISVSGLETTSYTPAAGLEPGTTYHWRVTAINGKGSTASAVGTFTTRALPTEPVTIDDFEDYPTSAELTAAYVRNPGGGAVTLTLAPGQGQAMQLDADPRGPGYAGVTRTFPAKDLWGQKGLRLTLQRPTGRTAVSVQFVAGGAYWEYTLPDDASGTVTIPFDAFRQPPWAPSGPLDLRDVTQLSFYTGGSEPARLVVDDVIAYP
ncbi:cellulase family glycosylhydrolase [Actinoplanes sp. NPDC024001]|uniref:cellulase family glycosylhydrolase n=1 Tax=Actinoplanes sp. NPDC024001 TaxID=3154598 RepID=UPI0033EA7E2F